MPEQVPFINREKQLGQVATHINDWNTLHFICIHAEGGIGKTRLLQEIFERYLKENRIVVTNIIDFDDLGLHVAENFEIRIANLLDEDTFYPFLEKMNDYRKMERAGVSDSGLSQAFEEGTKSFINCFNKFSKKQRTIILLDTVEKVQHADYFKHLLNTFQELKNCLIIMSGRNAKEIGDALTKEISSDVVSVIELFPLDEIAGQEYLKKKQDMVHNKLENKLSQKLFLLSGGKPIIMDLAVDWLSREKPFDWLTEYSINKIKLLPRKDKEDKQNEFERRLVRHIVQERSLMDNLILWASRVYPLDAEAISELLDLNKNEAEKLFLEAKKYVFVKSLPDGRITLHDEMRLMVNKYVWPDVDPEYIRQRHESKSAAKYFQTMIQSHTDEIRGFDEREKKAKEKGKVKEATEAFSKRVSLERETWVFKAGYLQHKLLIDRDEGVHVFIRLFDEATNENQLNSREVLLTQIQKYIDSLSSEQLYEVNIRRARHWFYKGIYSEVKKIVENLLSEESLLPEDQVELLILLANAEIRSGDIQKGVDIFNQAVAISGKEHLWKFFIKAKNGLGWACDLLGKAELAGNFYEEAYQLCVNQDGQYKKELEQDYGWILNNLAYARSTNKKNFMQALSIAKTAIRHWELTEGKLGLGAAYLVLGIVNHQDDRTKDAFDAFDKALIIFGQLMANDWLGEVYSWRGALSYDIKDYLHAEEDLKKALDSEAFHKEAMTRTRLGRLYLAQGKLDLAEIELKEAIKCAQEIPDYPYWLGALARRIEVSIEKGEKELDAFKQQLEGYISLIKAKGVSPKRIYLGIAKIALARLAFRYNDPEKEADITGLLEEGIVTVTGHGIYAGQDVSARLNELEQKDFDFVDINIIRKVGQNLRKIFISKVAADVTYSIVIPIMDRWANWNNND